MYHITVWTTHPLNTNSTLQLWLDGNSSRNNRSPRWTTEVDRAMRFETRQAAEAEATYYVLNSYCDYTISEVLPGDR